MTITHYQLADALAHSLVLLRPADHQRDQIARDVTSVALLVAELECIKES
jgi:hypothetical protein